MSANCFSLSLTPCQIDSYHGVPSWGRKRSLAASQSQPHGHGLGGDLTTVKSPWASGFYSILLRSSHEEAPWTKKRVLILHMPFKTTIHFHNVSICGLVPIWLLRQKPRFHKTTPSATWSIDVYRVIVTLPVQTLEGVVLAQDYGVDPTTFQYNQVFHFLQQNAVTLISIPIQTSLDLGYIDVSLPFHKSWINWLSRSLCPSCCSLQSLDIFGWLYGSLMQ